MICNGCGAPMIPLQQQGSFRCQYCGMLHIPANAQHPLPETKSTKPAITCPVCHIDLAPITVADRYHGHSCPNCQGMLFNQKTFKKSLKERQKQRQPLGHSVSTASGSDPNRLIHCPSCKQGMHTHLNAGSGQVLVDTCQNCKLIWLDYGEFDQAAMASAGGKAKRKYSSPSRPIPGVPTSPKALKKSFKKIKKKSKFDIFDLIEDIFD